MTPVELVASYLEGYNYTTGPTLPCNTQRVGRVAHKIAITSNEAKEHTIFIGQTGIYIWLDGMSGRLAIIPYADPEFKTKLRQIIGPP